MPYAVDLAGLTTIKTRGDYVLKMLLIGVLDMDNPVEYLATEVAGIGVRLDCNEERAEAIVRIIRQKYRHQELPLYYSKSGNGGWRYVNESDLAIKGESDEKDL